MIDHIRKLSSNQLLRNYLKVFSVDVLVKGAGIILLPVYLKLMTQEEYGVYGYLVAIISTFSLVFNLGIYTAQSKLYHEYPEDRRGSVLYTLNSILLGFTLCLLILILVFDIDYLVINFLFKNPLNYDQYRGSVLLGTIVSVYSLMIVNYFLTSEDLRKLQLFNISRILFINTIVIGLLFITNESDHALVRLKYSYLIEFLIIAFFAYFYVSKMKFKFDKGAAIKAIKISIPILISAVLGLVINLSDRYFIEKFGTLKDLSVYNLALTVSGIVPFVFASFQNIWLPQFLKEKDFQSNRARSKKMVVRLLVLFTLISVATLVLLKLMLMYNIIDTKYESIMPLLPIVMVTSIVISLTPMYSNHLIYLDKLHLIIVIGVPVAVLGIILNINLVPKYNIYGAAISTLITSVCYLISYLVLVNYFNREKTKTILRNPK